jgi:hypothetical protein
MSEQTNSAGSADWQRSNQDRKITAADPQAMIGRVQGYTPWVGTETGGAGQVPRPTIEHGLSAVAAKAKDLGPTDLSTTFRARKR